VLAFVQAKGNDGGAGALIVLLKGGQGAHSDHTYNG
jgi:DNA-nicking Smr family endonuclease